MSTGKVTGSAKHLIESMTGSASLPAFVQRIDPHTLKKLVDEVGIEDAGALVVHASEQQIAHLLDETIWTGARPGDPDKLSVAELLRWLDLWNGLGTQFAADKLFELGDDFCTLAFSRLLIVADGDLAPRVLDEHSQAIGTYVVRTRVDDEWDTVQTAVAALWQDYPDFTEAVFGRLSFRHSILKMFGEDDVAQVLDADAGHSHEQSREEGGYVTSIMAGSFLRDLSRADVDELALESAYDLQTQEYFRRRRQLQHARTPRAGEDDGAGPDEREPGAKAGESPIDEAAAEAELDQLEAELEHYERAQQHNVALLTGPENALADDADKWVKTVLGQMQTDADLFDDRMDELTFLANLLISGAEHNGERLSSDAAANLAVSTCNLGASHELLLTPAPAEVGSTTDDPLEMVAAMLSREPGLVKLFRIGWCLLTQLPETGQPTTLRGVCR